VENCWTWSFNDSKLCSDTGKIYVMSRSVGKLNQMEWQVFIP
jgi:hypothetical protein